MKRILLTVLVLLTVAVWGFGQTQVDLRTQSKNIDFSSAASTRPVKVGSSLPASCQPGELFFNTSATAGANLYGCTSPNTWTVESISAAPGASSISQLSDFAAALTSSTSLTVGASCSTSKPCNARFGNTAYNFKYAATVSLASANSGIVYLYIDNSGRLVAASSLGLTCTSCTYVNSAAGFPSDSIPLYTWTVTSGTFDTTGATDFRALLSSKNLVGGAGIQVVENAGASTLTVDSTLVSTRVAAPATSSGACTTGQFAFDLSYYYFCVAVNTWKRLALASF